MTAAFKLCLAGGARLGIACRAWHLPIVILYTTLMLGGCSIDSPFIKDEASSTQGETKSRPPVYYVGVESLKLYAEPGGSHSIIADLSQHQKVYRYKIEKGYAWVKLTWRLPKTTAADPTDKPEAEPGAPADAATQVSTPEPESQPRALPKPAPQSNDPSIFDAY